MVDRLASLFGRELTEIPDFALADDLDAPGVDIVREAGEGEAEFLDAGDVNLSAGRAPPAGQHLQTETLRRARHKILDGDHRTFECVILSYGMTTGRLRDDSEETRRRRA